MADLGFPRGGGANPKGGGAPTYYLANFSGKLHENEEILGQRGGRASLAPPLDPPLLYAMSYQVDEMALFYRIHASQTEDLLRTMAFQSDSEQVITSNVVRNFWECGRYCIKEPLCQAFSLDENMRCAVGSSRSPDVLEDASGITYYNTAA